MSRVVSMLVTVFLLSWSSLIHAIQLPGPLVETDWLSEHKSRVQILDVRKDTKSFTANPEFTKNRKTGKQKLVRVGGHIPGSVLVDYKAVRETRTVDGLEVTRLLPDKVSFEELMQASGVNWDSAIVIVPPGQGNDDLTMATRLYWTLKYYGHENLAILNGGVAQWIADGRKIATQPRKPRPGNWKALKERADILANTDDVILAKRSGSARLVDTRSLSQYLGTYKKSYVYDKGHIPGASVYPNELMNTVEMPVKFLPVEDLRQLVRGMGINPNADIITYCNSGHLASGGWYIFSELLGSKNVKLYDGSMHEWTLKKLPVKDMQME